MAIRQIRFDLCDVQGRPLVDSNSHLKLARTDEPVGNSYRLDIARGPVELELTAPAGSPLIVRLNFDRYRGIGFNAVVKGAIVEVPYPQLVVPRRPAAWLPRFVPWADLADLHEPLKRLLRGSPRLQLGQGTPARRFVGQAYDAVDPLDEISALAKACMLNVAHRLCREPIPTTNAPWVSDVEELLLVTRERILARATAGCLDRLRRLSAAPPRGYRKVNGKEHLKFFRGIPGVTDLAEPVSVKTDEARANLQLTAVRARLSGEPVVLLDADIDENGKWLPHALDYVRHRFDGGTHPLDIHEVLWIKFGPLDLGYDLRPRIPIGRVTGRILPG